MERLYDSRPSGNCYKARLLFALLDRPYERIPVDILAPGPRPAELLALSPTGKVPLLVLADGQALSESNAILHHMAEGTRFLPRDHMDRMRVLQWTYFEQSALVPNIASARYWLSIRKEPESPRARFDLWRELGDRALAGVDRHLEQNRYLVGDALTIADIAVYAYTHVAEEGGFRLDAFPAVQAWLDRVRGESGYVPLDA